MNKVKEFYEDHKKVIIWGIGGTIVVLVTVRVLDGQRIKSGDVVTRPDGSTAIMIHKKRARTVSLFDPSQEKQAV